MMDGINATMPWSKPVLREQEKPEYYKAIKETNLKELKEMVLNDRDHFISELIEGNVYVVRNAIDKDKLRTMRENVHQFGLTTEGSTQEIVDGIPNFHQIDDELEFYRLKKRAHVYHFFQWNEDTFGAFDLFKDVLDLYQVINGYGVEYFKDQSPSDDIVNRLQIHHYPSGGGYIANHRDPDIFLKTIGITLMSEYGKDYKSGGLYLLDYRANKLEVDPIWNVGDTVLAYPTIWHGCTPIDEEESLDWKSIKGRWLFLLNTLPTASGRKKIETKENIYTSYNW